LFLSGKNKELFSGKGNGLPIMKNAEAGMGTVLTIAGSDPVGGAGIQADIKTISAFGLYAMSVITAVTVQNTVGVQSVNPVAPELVAAQLDSIFTDLIPDVIKIGMLANEDIVDVVAEKLRLYCPRLVVLDPVMLSSSGAELLSRNGRRAMAEKIIPVVTIITPNLPEAKELEHMSLELYGDMEITDSEFHTYIAENIEDIKEDCVNDALDIYTEQEMEAISLEQRRMAERISLLFGGQMDKKHAILIKGGHLAGDSSDDYLYWFRQFSGGDQNSKVISKEIASRRGVMECLFRQQRIGGDARYNNIHGTGCTLSAAIAAGLARGLSVERSVREAKQYITGAIREGLFIGQGAGLLNHLWKQQL